MRKIWMSLIFLFGVVLPAFAEVGVLAVTDEAQHAKKEDFYHTFEYFIAPTSTSKQGSKCQATRIARKWFATAAHCVADVCKNGCEIQLDLLEYNPSALARITHTPQKPRVFVHPDYSPHIFAKNDFALLWIDLDHTPLTYYLRPTGNPPVRRAITEAEFNAFLAKNRRAKAALTHALHPKIPPLLSFEEGNFVLERNLSVISISNGKRAILQNPHRVYYVKELGFAQTENFGVVRGMSGSGVMSNTGELVGIIAGSMERWQGSNVNNMKKANEYFMFPVFNKSLLDFMKQTMGSDFDKLDIKDAYPCCVTKTRRDFSTIVEWVKFVDENSATGESKMIILPSKRRAKAKPKRTQ